ncbi:MAG: hypothetical protein QOJ62_2283 [Actinomycetota bacterium]|nr:hypothetical protein [Actinomycetota bacterium]
MSGAGRDDALANLLAKGERAAFHGPPGNAVPALEQAVELATASGRLAEATAASWLLGVAHAARGRFGTALTLLGGVMGPLRAALAGEETAPELRLFGALGAATVASVHRQLGRHTVAWEFDALGLTAADALPGLDEAVFDCRLGLASDAVGLGEVEIATTELGVAAGLVEAHPDWWRQRVRLDWVRAEVALLSDDPASAQEAASEAIDRAELARAPRHVAKGLLFLGVAQAQSGAAETVTTLRRAATLAEQLGTTPLIWPARALVGAMLAESDPATSARSLQAARSAVLAIAGDLPDDIREQWLARPDIEALLSI